MKIISWNVNGLLARIQNGFWDLIDEHNPEVICLQETKGDESQIPLGMDLITRGYEIFWNGGDSRKNGVAILVANDKFSMINLNNPIFDGRVTVVENEQLIFVNVYSPLSGTKLENLESRLKWDDLFRLEIQKLRNSKPMIICGDLNVAHRSYEQGAKSKLRKAPGFTDEEWKNLNKLLDLGFVDPTERFGLELNSEDLNVDSHSHSWRLDYTLVDENLIESVEGSFMISDSYGSDHYPIGLDLLF
jgi:exodeoxyribonuclease-3